MHFANSFFLSRSFRTSLRHCNLVKQFQSVVKVINTKDDDCIRLTFKYSNSPKLFVKAPKDQDVQMVLNRIKLMAALQRKKEEIRQAAVNRFTATAGGTVETIEEDVDVCLLQNNELLDEKTPNADAWSRASILKIGDCFYEVQYNLPTVVELTLPEYLVSCCPIRPHFILDCSSLNDSTFVWFRSLPLDSPEIHDEQDKRNFLVENDNFWLKVNEGFVYYTTTEDVGSYIKVVCTPKQGKISGCEYVHVSRNVVEIGPKVFPFEERHTFTKELCDNDR